MVGRPDPVVNLAGLSVTRRTNRHPDPRACSRHGHRAYCRAAQARGRRDPDLAPRPESQ